MNKSLPSALTPYDFIKAFAVMTMIADHVGVYFFPDDQWWRVAGRMSAPVWLFLVGYARTRDISLFMVGGASVLVLASGVIGPALLPMNILVNIIFIRLILDRAIAHIARGLGNALELVIFMVLLAVPTAFISDYGMVGLSVAIFGYCLRRGHDNAPMHNFTPLFSGLIAFVLFYGLVYISFDFTVVQKIAAFVLSAISFVLLWNFRPIIYPMLTLKMPRIFTAAVQFCGRRSLEIYVAHLLIFKIAAWVMGYTGYDFMAWRILAE